MGGVVCENLGTKAVAKARKQIAREMRRTRRYEIIVLANVRQVEKTSHLQHGYILYCYYHSYICLRRSAVVMLTSYRVTF